jgi:hypothetical protein
VFSFEEAARHRGGFSFYWAIFRGMVMALRLELYFNLLLPMLAQWSASPSFE